MIWTVSLRARLRLWLTFDLRTTTAPSCPMSITYLLMMHSKPWTISEWLDPSTGWTLHITCLTHSKAIRYYQENLCYSPNQFDSWAGLAVARSRIILDRLNQVSTHLTPLTHLNWPLSLCVGSATSRAAWRSTFVSTHQAPRFASAKPSLSTASIATLWRRFVCVTQLKR